MMTKRVLYIFAGPNGSGKSSIVAKYLHERPYLNYYCADEISKELPFQKIEDESKRNFEAMQETERRVYEAMEDGMAVAYETVLSSDYKWPIFDKALTLGYHITVIFVTTQNPKINLARVQQRVAAGGHPVPPEKIVARYEKSMQRLPKLMTYAQDAFVFDNSADHAEAELVLYKHDHDIFIRQDCQWIAERMMAWRKKAPHETERFDFTVL